MTNAWTDPDQVLPGTSCGSTTCRTAIRVSPSSCATLFRARSPVGSSTSAPATATSLECCSTPIPISTALCARPVGTTCCAPPPSGSPARCASRSHSTIRRPLRLRGPVRCDRVVVGDPSRRDHRKQTLFAEAAGLLAPGGVFANLDIVASPTPALHDRWRGRWALATTHPTCSRRRESAPVAPRRRSRRRRLHLEVAQPRAHAAASSPDRARDDGSHPLRRRDLQPGDLLIET